MKASFVSSWLILFLASNLFSQTGKDIESLDSIRSIHRKIFESEKSIEERIELAKEALTLSKKQNNDSLLMVSGRLLSYQYLIANQDEEFLIQTDKFLKLANAMDADLEQAHLSNFKGYYFYSKQVNDSAFYYYSTAADIFESLDMDLSLSGVLLNLSAIQRTEKDFIGSEESAIKAIEILKKAKKTETILDDLWILYNGLGINSRGLKLYFKSLDYFDEAISIANSMEDGLYNKLYSLNNKAYTLRQIDKYQKALDIYNFILETENLYEDDPGFFALILESVAITKFAIEKVQSEEIERLFDRALVISDSIGEDVTKVGVLVSKANYYEGIGNKDKALQFANETYQLAKRIKQNEIFLESLTILARLKEGDEGKKYLEEHIKLSDSLLNYERNIRNKFARIKFETDELEAENRRIARERLWLLGLSISLLLAAVLIYIIVAQRAKNKELKFTQEQQRANEEIYNLMLSQQDKIDEARVNEKKRISQELHDGVLGRMFGVRLSLDSLNFNTDIDSIKTRAQYIKDLMKIEQDIRQVSHNLNTDFISGTGFIIILEELVSKQTEAYNLDYTFNFDDSIQWDTVPNKTKINLYRITQESLQNIYKHAKAKHITISIKLINDVICLTIKDDGLGFDTGKSKKGIGLKNINSRITELGGTVKFKSEPGKGTEVIIEVPIQKIEHEHAN
ncbi:two-component sensor histidine kinase [Paucihalobacter ruber]|uniref:Oxygen sensor histidine kinase NreB n=1 Tax=Paucihalobacter ruber TaxID=2567861 RepID=A0A506PD90_9FLAO|nr:sensor histidine kinase [Paucihalobacter ruber]TPV31796.1 two-component sensor histidine kinase [Paucihalobacter ruber]